MDYMTLKEAGEKWGVTVWLIPKNTEKPIDGRTKKARSNRNGK